MVAIQEGVTSILEDDDEEMGGGRVSVLGAYQRSHQKKQEAAANEVRQKEQLWTKKSSSSRKQSGSHKVVPTDESNQQDLKNIPRGYDKVRIFSDEGKRLEDDDDLEEEDLDDE
jgi:hypothetical protein